MENKYFRLPFQDFAGALGLFVVVVAFIAIAKMIPFIKRWV